MFLAQLLKKRRVRAEALDEEKRAFSRRANSVGCQFTPDSDIRAMKRELSKRKMKIPRSATTEDLAMILLLDDEKIFRERKTDDEQLSSKDDEKSSSKENKPNSANPVKNKNQNFSDSSRNRDSPLTSPRKKGSSPTANGESTKMRPSNKKRREKSRLRDVEKVEEKAANEAMVESMKESQRKKEEEARARREHLKKMNEMKVPASQTQKKTPDISNFTSKNAKAKAKSKKAKAKAKENLTSPPPPPPRSPSPPPPFQVPDRLIAQLLEMGFDDPVQIECALRHHSGDVELAMNQLLC